MSQAYEQLTDTGGMLMFLNNPDFIFETTWPTLYRYLPTDIKKRKDTKTNKAGFVFLSKTQEIYSNIIHWWVLCALEEWCMAPKLDKEKCATSGLPEEKRIGVFGKCHRYDQSAINILAANHFRYNFSKYTSRKTVGNVRRRVTNDFVIKRCIVDGTVEQEDDKIVL